MMLLPLITWLEAVSVSILRREVAPFPPFSSRALGQEALRWRLHWRSGAWCSTPFTEQYSHNLLGVLLHGRFVCSLPFNHLLISAWNQGYLLFLWVIVHYCSVLLLKVVQLGPLAALSVVFCATFTCPVIGLFCLFLSTYFLMLEELPG